MSRRLEEGARVMSRALTIGRFVGVAAALPALLVLVSAWARPATAGLGTPGAPVLFVDDGPLTRNATVTLIIDADVTYSSPAVEWRAANDPSTSNGLLVNGASVPTGLGDWTLAAGPDGPRTIYGQARHADGTWSPVASITLELDIAPLSRIVFDVQPTTALAGSVPFEDIDWHTEWATPGDRIFGDANAWAGGSSFTVGTSTWSVGFSTEAAPLAPGTYDIPHPQDQDPEAEHFATIGHLFGSCPAGGEFTIQEIELTPDGDLERVDADYRLECWGGTVAAGSIRYGADRDIVALDQSDDVLHFGNPDIGGPPTSRTVTFSNVGDVPDTLGQASITGVAATDFTILEDGCSGETLAVNESCSVEVELDPSERGSRVASLALADGTPRGARTVRLSGTAFQPVTLDIHATELPEFGPAPTTIVVTAYPGTPFGYPVLEIDGIQGFGVVPVRTELTNPTRVESSWTVTLGPGEHHLEGIFIGGEYFRAADPAQLDIEIGTATSLELTTTTDDGVADGESATLIARLTTGGPVTGTLRIRDEGGDGPILASATVSGDDPSITHVVTRGLGSHSFAAEFIPSSPDIQAADDAYAMDVVSGPRPETEMDDSAMHTWDWFAVTEFSSPTPNVTFECVTALGLQIPEGAHRFPCSSPQVLSTNQYGTVTVNVRARLPNGLADRTPATRLWISELYFTGTTAIDDDATYADDPAVTVATLAPEGAPSVTHVGLSNDGVNWTTRTYAANQSWNLVGGNGSRTVYTRWRDAGANWSTPATDTIILDTKAPTTSAPSPTLTAGSQLASGKIPVSLSWAGNDATSGISEYRISWRKDGGAWSSPASVTSPAYTRLLAPGHTYRFRVRGIDGAGNLGEWVSGSTFRVAGVPQGGGASEYDGSWATFSSSSYWGGSVKASSDAGSRVRFTFTGKAFGWLTAVGPARGSARIYVNGTLRGTVDLYAATSTTRVIGWTRTWAKSATRTIEIRVVATPGRPRIDIDGFWTLR